jgi:hypothetical protein
MTTTKPTSIELIRATLHAAQFAGLNASADMSLVDAGRALCGGGGNADGLPEIDSGQMSYLDLINQLLHLI